MEVYKNTEVAEIYNVSNTAVNRWVDSAVQKNNNLQVIKLKEKYKIIKSKHNESELQRLKETGLIFKNKSERVNISPKVEFYDIFKEEQIVEIINFLETRLEIPHKFAYVSEGGKIWDSFIKKNTFNQEYVTTSSDTVLLKENLPFLKTETDKYSEIKIIEIGGGNMYSTKEFVEYFVNTGKLKKYTAIDISKNLIDISKKNLEIWNIPVEFDYFVADVEHDNLSSIFFKDKTNTNKNSVINIIVCVDLFGNLDNRRKALENLRTSMGKDDLLLITNRRESKSGRTDLSFLTEVYDLFLWIPKLLNLDTQNLEIICEYSDENKRREARLKLDKDYQISFKLGSTERIINLSKGQEIIVWFSYMSTLSSIISESENAGLEPIHISTHKSLSRILIISEAKNIS